MMRWLASAVTGKGNGVGIVNLSGLCLAAKGGPHLSYSAV
jgi:hypothetical protein